MAKMNLKGSNHLDDLIGLIEQNDIKNIEILVKLYPEVLGKKCFDDYEPIYFAIRIKGSKIFQLLLNNSENAAYDLSKMMKTIIEEGTRKMMKSFIDYYKLNLQLPMFKPYIDQILLKHTQFLSYLINETSMPFSISITPQIYSALGYTCPYEQINGKFKLIFNKSEECECYDIDAIIQNNQLKKIDFVFMKYEKLFYYTKKSTKLQKALKEDTFKEILGYI